MRLTRQESIVTEFRRLAIAFREPPSEVSSNLDTLRRSAWSCVGRATDCGALLDIPLLPELVAHSRGEAPHGIAIIPDEQPVQYWDLLVGSGWNEQGKVPTKQVRLHLHDPSSRLVWEFFWPPVLLVGFRPDLFRVLEGRVESRDDSWLRSLGISRADHERGYYETFAIACDFLADRVEEVLADAIQDKGASRRNLPKACELRAAESYRWVIREAPHLVPEGAARTTRAMHEHILLHGCPAYEGDSPPANFETWKRQVRAGLRPEEKNPPPAPRAGRERGSAVARSDEI